MRNHKPFKLYYHLTITFLKRPIEMSFKKHNLTFKQEKVNSKQINGKKRRENSRGCTKSGFARGCLRKTFNNCARGLNFNTILVDSFCFKGHCFGGSGYFGVGEPQFFYADMTALTLGKIFRLLGFKFQLPPPVAQTGFPEGASVSGISSLWYYYCLFFSLVL